MKMRAWKSRGGSVKYCGIPIPTRGDTSEIVTPTLPDRMSFDSGIDKTTIRSFVT